MSNIKIINQIHASALGETFEVFLQKLGGPTWLVFKGKDMQRMRVVSTLLHGNEVSGARALYQILKEGIEPATHLACFIGNISAALAEPKFSFRFLAGRRDMNRCFKPPFEGEEGQIALELMALITESSPEALLDVHNTSGSSTGFSISTQDNAECEYLGSLFSERLIITDLTLGSLMEFGATVCPTVTVECGGIEDKQSDVTAYEGLKRFIEYKDVFDHHHAQRLQKFYHPLRVELTEEASIGYSSSQIPEWDITLPLDIEQYNYKVLQPGDFMGWLGHKGLSSLSILNSQRRNVVSHYFAAQEHKLVAKMPLKLFMVTTNPHIAKADCLFYFVEPEIL